jgi:hypothetical protein
LAIPVFQEEFMRIVFKLLLTLSLASLITACIQKPAAGTLEVKITGLPSGTNPNVTVTKPDGTQQVIATNGTTTIPDALIGAYTVTAANVTGNSINYSATITGSPTNVSDGATSSVGVTYGALRTITGKVLNGAGQPLTAASLLGTGTSLNVKLLGSTATIVVDANGTFTLADVPATYSLAVLLSSQYSRSATVYQDLTRADPSLTILQGQFGAPFISGPSSNTSVSGKVTGGSGFNGTNTSNTTITLALPKAVRLSPSSGATVDPMTGAYFTSTTWLGNDPVTATLHALQFSTDINGNITGYGGYGQQSVNLTAQGPLPPPTNPPGPITPPVSINQDVALTTVSSGNVKGSITWPTGVATPSYQVFTTLLLGGTNEANFNLFKPNGPPPLNTGSSSYDQLVPLIPGAKFLQLLAIDDRSSASTSNPASGSAIWRLVTPGTPTDIALPAPISLSLPTAGANNVGSGTGFSWSKYPDGIYILNFNPVVLGPPTAGSVSFQIVTSKPNTTIPDLSPYDFGLPKASSYSWGVQGIAPYSSIDAATDAAGLVLPTSSPPPSNGGYSSSTVRLLTTAP